jgi:DnaJ-class molecular chaperone
LAASKIFSATCLALAMCLAIRAVPVRGALHHSAAPILRYDLEITLEQASEGMTAQLRIPKLETCETCSGSGAKPGTKPETCRTCQGIGQVRFQQGFFSVARTCTACRGGGQVISFAL